MSRYYAVYGMLSNARGYMYALDVIEAPDADAAHRALDPAAEKRLTDLLSPDNPSALCVSTYAPLLSDLSAVKHGDPIALRCAECRDWFREDEIRHVAKLPYCGNCGPV